MEVERIDNGIGVQDERLFREAQTCSNRVDKLVVVVQR
jgi:hypothetical protein